MSGPALLEQLGAKTGKQTKYTPIFLDRLFTGLFTNRNLLLSPGTRVDQKYYGGHPDALFDGLNIELSVRLTLIRRPGLLQYSTASIPAPTSFYEFDLLNGSIDVIVDTPSTIFNLTTMSANPICVKAPGAGQAFFQGVGNTLYFGDGVEQLAWQNNFLRNWGIASPAGFIGGGDQILYAGDAGAPFAWTNPANAVGPPDGQYAECFIAFGDGFTPDPLPLTQYGFAVANTSTITGIQVDVTAYCNPSFPAVIPQLTVNTLNNGMASATSQTLTINAGAPQTYIFGGPGQLWGSAWNPSLVNMSNFGAQIIPVINEVSIGYAADFFIDAVKITVFFSDGLTVTPSGSGSLSTVNGGWEYEICYGNSASAQVSSPLGPTLSTGDFTDVAYVGIPVVASTDPQVNQIRIFRTKDGGDQFYELPTSPYTNTTTTIQDSNLDTSLNILSLAPGITLNNPPPIGLINPVEHLQRIWGSVGNVVYYSGGPDTYTGNGFESFPPANNFTFPYPVKRLVPGFGGMLVLTQNSAYIITGTASPSAVLSGAASSVNVFQDYPFGVNIGIGSYNAVDTYGNSIFVFTNDRRFLQIDPSSGVTDLGFPLGDIFYSSLNPSLVKVAYYVGGSQDTAVFLGDGSTGWYRCNPNQYPELSGPVWSPKAIITQGCQAIANIQTSPGVHSLLVGSASAGTVLYRDLNTFSDNGEAYTAFLSMGNIVLAQPNQLAEVESITTECKNVGTQPTIGVLLDEISGSFETLTIFTNDPPELVPSTSLLSNRFYLNQGGDPAWCRHMQIKVTFATEVAANELLSLTVFGTIHQEK